MPRDPALEYLELRSRSIDRRHRLRPRTSSELLDAAANLYRSHGLVILRHIAAPMAGSFAVIVLYLAIIAPNMFLTNNADDLSRQVGEVLQVVLIGLFVALPAFLIGIAYTCGAATQISADAILDVSTSDRRIQTSAKRALPTVFWAMLRSIGWIGLWFVVSILLLLVGAAFESANVDNDLVSGICAIIGVLGIGATLITSPIVMSKYALAPAAVVVEGLTARDATRRAVELMQRTPGPLGGGGGEIFTQIWGLMILVGFAVLIGISLPADLFSVSELLTQWLGRGTLGEWAVLSLNLLPWLLTLWLIVPFWSVTTTLLYFDRRIRREAFDIAILGSDMQRSSRETRRR